MDIHLALYSYVFSLSTFDSLRGGHAHIMGSALYLMLYHMIMMHITRKGHIRPREATFTLPSILCHVIESCLVSMLESGVISPRCMVERIMSYALSWDQLGGELPSLGDSLSTFYVKSFPLYHELYVAAIESGR